MGERPCDVTYIDVGHILEATYVPLENKLLVTWKMYDSLSMSGWRARERTQNRGQIHV